MKKVNNKPTLSITRSIPLLTFIAANILVLDVAVGAAISPFYPIPAYLSSKAETVRPNVMLMVDTSGSMGGTRIATAKTAYTDLVRNNPDLVRWGFSTFHVKDFIPVQDNNANAVVNQISQIVASGNTPTAPMYYQLIRYFEGLTPTTVTGASSVVYYGDWAKRRNDSTTRPPFQYRCQKNFIINLSDGDANAGSLLSERTGDSIFGSLSTATTAFPDFSKKAYETDFKKNSIDGVDAEGQPWDDPAYPLQNIITYTIGFGTGMSTAGKANLEQAAAAGGGKYYAAGDSAALVASLQDALANIAAMTRPPVPPVYLDPTDPTATNGAISVNFSSQNWSSQIVVNATNSDGTVDFNNQKSIGFPVGNNRNLWFKSVGTGNVVSLKTNNTVDTANSFGVTTAEAVPLATWLRGQAVDSSSVNTRASYFGDVLNGDISVTNKGELFSLAANDGMVHVFKKNGSGSYDETFVYMPTLSKRSRDGISGVNETLGQVVKNLTKRNYGEPTNPHQYLVDGGAFYRGYDAASIGGEKHFVVGATGRGAAGAYALDMKHIRDTGGNNTSVIFDVTNGSMNNLGYTVGTPIIVKVKDGGSTRLVALVSNGFFSLYDNATKKGISTGAQGVPSLYGINLEDPSKGSVWRELTVSVDRTPSSNKNGFAAPAAVDIDDDGVADYVYAGDLKGDLYRIDLRDSRANADNIVKIFSGTPSKPITSAPAIFKHKNGKYVVVFGTGSLLEESDNTSIVQQTVYGIIEDYDVTGNYTKLTEQPVSESALLDQEIIPVGDSRMISNHALDATHKGWKLNLSSNTGERVVYQPIINGDTVFFSTQIIIPPMDGLLCAMSSGSGYIMSVDAETGGQPIASNAHYGITNAAGEYYAGQKRKGFVANVGGMIVSPAGKLGTNDYGQVVSGLVSTLNKPPKPPKDCLNMTIAGEAAENVCVKPKNTAVASNVRVLSWREIF